MRFLADENVEGLLINTLRTEGHDVAQIGRDSAGLGDHDVLARATQEQRILLTNDKDFAELAFLQRSAATGIILIRLPRSTSLEKTSRVLGVIADHADRLPGAMTVVDERGIRRRSLSLLTFKKGSPPTDG